MITRKVAKGVKRDRFIHMGPCVVFSMACTPGGSERCHKCGRYIPSGVVSLTVSVYGRMVWYCSRCSKAALGSLYGRVSQG
jgi:hypothetical protein